MEADFILADRGYDSDKFRASIICSGAQPVIPSKSLRKQAHHYDKIIYKERNFVERAFQKLKHYRRVATRYERLGTTYSAILSLVSTLIWLT